ncbi:MAG: hypothetical protein IMZ55_12785, partial [Acidobacteria bacterium]|nr:hypothetical protein [Acidobacteriota bacterium]
MALLDRFRRPPQWKHEDPFVRITGVEELPLDRQDLLITIAREDGDARVRRAAVKKIINPSVLAEVARQDRDESVRDEAGGILRDVALGVFENTTEAESLAALALLIDARDMVAVAETASLESVRTAALARLDEPRVLGAVARRAAHAPTRLAALQRLSDAGEVCAVALKSEHKDVALAAVERLTDREALKSVAGRAVHKAVARRAKVLLDALEPQERPAAEAPAREVPAAQARTARQLDLCRLAEALAKSPSGPDTAARLAKAEEMWSELGAGVDADLHQRFGASCEKVRAARAQTEADRAERERVDGEVAAAVAARTALCDSLASIEGEGALARLEEA